MRTNIHSLLRMFLVSFVMGIMIIPGSLKAQITNGNFEIGAGLGFTNWTTVNSGTNAWYCGALGAQAGVRGAFISSTGGASLTYNKGNSQVSHFYQAAVNIPAGQNILQFNWKGFGENNYDFLEVFLVPNGTPVTAGIRMGIINRVGGPYQGQSAWQLVNVNLGCFASAQSRTIVFSWVNDGSLGTDPPGCIDNVTLITNPLPVTGLTCANAVNIAALPYNVAGESTACMGNDYTAATPGICNGTFAFGEDKVYSYTATGTECISITLTGTSTNDIGFAVYQGCPGGGGVCIGSGGPATSNILSGSVTLPAAGTYYIMIDSRSPSSSVSYNLLINSFGAGAFNDAPWQAQPLPFNIPIAGNNTCSGGSDEPAQPACFLPAVGNVMNSVWFSFTAPASGCVKVRTVLGTLTNTQIALFGPVLGTIPAGSGNTLIQRNCNQDQAACGSNQYANSEFTASALSPGFTYYIMVDGFGNTTGSFSIYIIDGGIGCVNQFSPTPGQDCLSPFPVCKTSINIANPGPQAFGTFCDFPNGVNCLASGERGSYWYKIAISAAGFLEFNIVPNDWPGPPSTAATDYDFAVWRTKTAGVAGPANCTNLSSTAPVSCNYSALGVTGTYGASNGVAPPAFPGFGGAYQQRITVAAGDEYYLNISNFSNSTSGFTLNFSATSPIAYTPAAGGNLLWTGSLSTDWYNPENWGGCAVPNCVYNVVIPAAPVNQPNITGLTAVCGSVDINIGATLSMAANSQLKVCNNFVNNGSLLASANSTILMQSDSAVQNQSMTGAMTGANALWNLTISKPATAGGNTVTLNNDLDNRGNVIVNTTNSGGSFNASGRYHKVAGNFTVWYASIPYGVYSAASTLEFNGTANQNYFNRGSLNSVLMNSGAGGQVTLGNSGATDWMLIGGTLTLTNGRILTGANRVNVINSAVAAVSTGNVTSYVEGTLKRNLLAAGGAYDFPVGTALRGYQRINFDINNPNPKTNMQVSFNNAAPGAYPVLGPECVTALFDQTALNHGLWSVFTTPPSGSSPTFNATAYNRSYSNPQSGFTIMSKYLSNPWTLEGVCVPASPITAIQRNGMTTLNTGLQLAIAQALTPLPIDLLSFDAYPKAKSITLKFVTASEVNNRGFEIQRSLSPPEFKNIGWVDGHGTTSEIHEYSFDDRDVVPNNTYYYRLKQIDFDGKSEFSEIVAAKITGSNFFMNVIPNPYSGKTNITFSLESEADVSIEVLNTMGQRVALLDQGMKAKGDYRYDFSAKEKGFATGMYTVRVIVNGEIHSKRIVELD
jgi:hypothetical protein